MEIEKGRESMDGRFYIGWWRHFKKKKTGNRASREVNVDFHQHRPVNKAFVRKFYRTGPLKSPPLTPPPRFLSADRPNLFAGQLHFPGRRIERRPPLRGRSTSETGTPAIVIDIEIHTRGNKNDVKKKIKKKLKLAKDDK